MTNVLQAIETRYGGRRYRSRREARWAVFFDSLGVRFEYEPEGYVLPDGQRYLPDFWLSDLDCWIEIKATRSPQPDEQTKLRQLTRGTGHDAFVFFTDFGVPYVRLLAGGAEYEHEGTWAAIFTAAMVDDTPYGLQHWAECRLCGVVSITHSRHWYLHGLQQHDRRAHAAQLALWDANSTRLVRAYEAALSARFEFGASG